jgi:hypothetical protein
MASYFFRVNPAGSYLSVDIPGGATKPISPTSIKISDLGLKTGDSVAFRAQGDYRAGTQFSDDSTGLSAVFVDQSGQYLAPQTYRAHFSENQYSGEKTDIAQDFELSEDVTESVIVPANTYAILFSVHDSYYSDNTDPDGDFGVTIKTGTDTLVSGSDFLRLVDRISELSKNNDDDGLPFFQLVNVKPFITQNWGSQVVFSGASTYRTVSSEGSTLEAVLQQVSRSTSESENSSIKFSNYSGDRLDVNFSEESTRSGSSESGTGSLSYAWSYIGSSSTQSDDVQVQLSMTNTYTENSQNGLDNEEARSTFDVSVAIGDRSNGYRYQIKGTDYSLWRSRNGATTDDNNAVALSKFSFEDYKAGLSISFTADKQSDWLLDKTLVVFNNISATFRDKSYSSARYTLSSNEADLKVELGDIYSLTPFFRDVLLPKLPSEAVSSSNTTSTTSSSGGAGTSPSTIPGATTGSTSSTTTTTTTTTTPATTTPAATTPVAPIIPNGTEKSGSDAVDRLQGGSGPDVIRSGGGSDVIIGSDGNDYIDGGTGVDQLSYSSRAGSISFAVDTGGNVQVRLGSKTDTLVSVERISFTDKAYALDLDGSAGKAAKAIIAAFGKNTVSQYLGIALTMTDKGASITDLAKIVVDNKMLPSDNGQFVQTVFNNVVGRAPNALELLQFKGILDRGEMTTTQLLTLAAQSAFTDTVINEVAIAGVALEYQPTLSI